MSALPYETRPGGGLDDLDDDGYDREAIAGVPVPRTVPPGVPPAVPFPVPSAVPGDSGPAVPPEGNAGPFGGFGQWEPAPGDDAGRGGAPRLGRAREWAAGHAKHPVFGGGPGGLIAELADPHPGTWREHSARISGHQAMPEGQWGQLAFVTGHFLLTGPVKAAGKILTAAGSGMAYTGKRVDWIGDRAIRVTAAYVILAMITILIWLLIIR